MFEVGFANHVMEKANSSNLLPSARLQTVTIISTKVYRNSPLLMLLSHHSMVAPSRDLSRFLNPDSAIAIALCRWRLDLSPL